MRFIDAHKGRFGVAPICRVLSEHGLKIAPSTYYDAKSRPRSKRALRDEELRLEIARVPPVELEQAHYRQHRPSA